MCYHDDAETFREELGHRFEGHCGGSDKLNSGNGVLFTGSLTQWRLGMVMDTSEPRDYEIRALCMECGRFRSKKITTKPEARDVEEMA